MLQNRVGWQCECFKLLLGQQWVNLIGIYSTIKMEKNRLVEESQSTMEQVCNETEREGKREREKTNQQFLYLPANLAELSEETCKNGEGGNHFGLDSIKSVN